MFRITKQLFFNGNTQKNERKSLEKPYELTMQVILCGSHANEVLANIKNIKLKPKKNKAFYALRYRMNGEVVIGNDVNVNSDVPLQKPDNKDKQPIFQQIIKTNIDTTRQIVDSIVMKQCDPDFQSNSDMFVVVAAKNDDESRQIIPELIKAVGNHKVSHCILLHRTDTKSLSDPDSVGLPASWPLTHLSNTADGFAKSLARDIPVMLWRASKEYLDSLEKEFVVQVKGPGC